MIRSTLRLFDGFPHTSPDLKDEVRKLQEYLKVIPDGLFGKKTEDTVIAFQQQNGLIDDGIVGPVTWSKILNIQIEMPKYETSISKNNISMLKMLSDFLRYEDMINEEIVKFQNIDVPLIFGVGCRESRWGDALTPKGPTGVGDCSSRGGRWPHDGYKGFGRGLMQIDYDAHEFARIGDWKHPKTNINYGMNVLNSEVKYFTDRGYSIAHGVAAYNCGRGNINKVINLDLPVDYYTAHRNYSKDVLNYAGWFEYYSGLCK